MTQIKLSKSALSMEQKNLKNYKQFLPSLDLKRRKLLAEKIKAQDTLRKLNEDIRSQEIFVTSNFPMIAETDLELDGLVNIKSAKLKHENIVGVSLPVLDELLFDIKHYSFFNTPQWFDNFIQELKKNIELEVQHQIAEKRVILLEQAARVITQRTNLFEKVLIPKTKKLIKTIQIFLADNERAAVVRSKIAKKKRCVK